MATDLKRLLAYSTTENMGLVTLALGAATLFAGSGAPGPATIAMAAAMLHLIGHAAFKCLGFLAAGSVLTATGLRDLDRLGGLARRMPATTTLFGVAALGASGLPLGAGFVSEWLLVQSLIHAAPGQRHVGGADGAAGDRRGRVDHRRWAWRRWSRRSASGFLPGPARAIPPRARVRRRAACCWG